MEKILFLILILVAIYYFTKSKEGFENWGTDYESISLSPVAREMGFYPDSQNPYDNGFYGHKGYMNPMDGQNYAEKIAKDLNKPFGYPNRVPVTGPSWDPASYTLKQEPDGQFVGQISPN